MFRKRATPAPGFRQPSPFNPITGQFAQIGKAGIVSRVAMMQVIEEDTHDNYVVCRGFDPETQRFYSTINVAKPYGARGSGSYQAGQVFAAIKAKTLLGDTSGVAKTTVGHPADLDEVVEILKDDDGNPIAWLLLDASGSGVRIGVLSQSLAKGGSATFSEWTVSQGSFSDAGKDDETVYDWLMKTGAANIASGKKIVYTTIGDTNVLLEAECE